MGRAVTAVHETFDPMSQESFEGMMERFNDALAQTYRFHQTFDETVFIALLGDELNARWEQLGFGARFVANSDLDGSQRAWCATSPAMFFWLCDDPEANDGKPQARIRKEMAHQLHDELVQRGGYDEQEWADFIEECVEARASAGAELEALASNYDNVRVAIVGYGLPEYNEVEGPSFGDTDTPMLHYMGRLRLDLAVWTVPLA